MKEEKIMEERDPHIQTSSGEESEIRAGGSEFQVERREMPAENGTNKHSEQRKRSSGTKGVFKQSLDKTGNQLKKRFGRLISPAFLLMLVLSFGMWYMTKLGYTYVSDIEVRVNIEGHKMVIPCMAEGEGTDLLRGGKTVNIKWADLDVTPSAANPGHITISYESLRNAISVGRPDIKIISIIGAIPEVEL